MCNELCTDHESDLERSRFNSSSLKSSCKHYYNSKNKPFNSSNQSIQTMFEAFKSSSSSNLIIQSNCLPNSLRPSLCNFRSPKSSTWSLKMFKFLILTMTIISQHVVNCSWQEAIEPKITVQLKDTEVQKFNGNSTYYRLLEKHNDYMLVGSRNLIFNISLTTLEENNVSSFNLFF